MYVCYHICHVMPSYHIIVYYTEFILSSIFICYIIYSVMYCCTLQVHHTKYAIYYMYVKSCNIYCCKYVMLNMLSIICYAMLRNVSISSWSCISSYVQVTLCYVRVSVLSYSSHISSWLLMYGVTAIVTHTLRETQQLWHVEYMGPQQLWSMYFSC